MTALAVRLDNFGDVLLTAPATRALRRSHERLVYLASPRGRAAAELLPGIDQVETFDAPWIGYDAASVDQPELLALVERIRAWSITEAVVFTSFHQSALPMAMLLRMAGVEKIAATSVDHPGSLLDVREPYHEHLHEVEQNLAVCRSAGHALAPSDPADLRLDLDTLLAQEADERFPAPELSTTHPYVVVHPGASVPARALPLERASHLVNMLTDAAVDVVVTGSVSERALVERVAAAATQRSSAGRAFPAAGSFDLARLALLLRDAQCLVVGNTGPAHLSAAVGTPVVQAFAPVVPLQRWRPWGVSHICLGSTSIECAGCRSTTCPIPGQPCLDPFTAEAAFDAIQALSSGFTRRVSASPEKLSPANPSRHEPPTRTANPIEARTRTVLA